MKYLVLGFSLCLSPLLIKAQIISQFTWDDPAIPVTTADIGPDATSISPSAISDVGGVGGTNGLNPSLPKRDIVMTLPGSPTFDVDGIDMSVDYQRDESVANFFDRGASLSVRCGANFSVTYRVDDGVGGFVTVSSGNIYSIPNDDVFRTYRFYYLPDTGVGALLVDGVVQWTNDGPDGRPLYWTGAGDLVIGQNMDASGSDRTTLDNVIIASVTFSPLPIELVSFNVTAKNDYAEISWQTASELNNAFFTLERSVDGMNWNELATINGAGTTSVPQSYIFNDMTPYNGVNYYRLKQTDFDGAYEYFDPKSAVFQNDEPGLLIYPNPAISEIVIQQKQNLDVLDLHLFNALGQEVTDRVIMKQTGDNQVQVSTERLQSGMYFVRTMDGRFRSFLKTSL
jgi:hypothetical protein